MAKILAADIGGTYIRFWTIKNKKIQNLQIVLQNKKTPIEKAIQICLETVDFEPDCFIAGAAGPLQEKGVISLTNRDLTIDMPKICKKFGFKYGILANDIVFHAMSVIDKPDTDNACVVMIGTGCGCAYIKGKEIQASEDGHLQIEHPEKEVKKMKLKTWENALSGPSFLKIYRLLNKSGKPVAQSREVSFLAHNSKDKTALETYKIIAKTLADFCLTIAEKKKIPVFYLGGLATELMRSRETQEVFFESLGKKADILSFRLIKQSDQPAMNGLKKVAEEVIKTGKISQIRPADIYILKND